MHSYVCTTCGVGYAPTEAPREICLICADDRQYVNPAGQGWTTSAELEKTHLSDIRSLEPNLIGIGAKPQIGIGQRALVITQPGGGVMWDCTPLVTEEAIETLKVRGGLRAIAISHPHFFATMVEWSKRLGGVPVYLHEDHRDWVMRPSDAIKFWSGETFDLGQGVTLIRCGGHFPGSTVLHWAEGAGGKGVLMSGDTIMVVPDTRWLSFMYSYPNLVPLNARAVERIVKSVRAYSFDRIYAGWWDRICQPEAKDKLQRSAERYIAAIR